MIKILCVLLLLLTGCNTNKKVENAVKIQVSDQEVLVDGIQINSESENVYVKNDIIYYEEGKDFTYGEGSKEDEHSIEDASKHQVLHITKAGTYELSGKLSYGQIAIDLGENAKNDPNAVVTLILNNLDITCEVAPAIIFYNVYECGNSDETKATKDVDTSKAGANVIIKDHSINNVNGSYVARIYKEGSVVLNESKTEVEDAKKLHKYDGAFYSKMSLNIYGEKEGNGILNIHAKNEGLDSELHLTINGGVINITSGNDGMNTNEDGISVTTINGGNVNIFCDGSTGEGDGIDSNGWLVINGGSVVSQACATSGDAGIDSDNGIYINGGNVKATGNMLDRIAGGNQTYAVFSFNQRQTGNSTYTLKDADGKVVEEISPKNAFTYLIVASDELKAGEYTLWQDEQQLSAMKNQLQGGKPQGKPENFPQNPTGMEKPDKPVQDRPNDFDGHRPDKPEGEGAFDDQGKFPFGEIPENFEGMTPPNHDENMNLNGETSTKLVMTNGANQFIIISE